MPEIHASMRGISRGYPGAKPVHALGPLDLDIVKGEFFAVVGPSGCGKSTLLDVLAGLSAPSEGTIAFEGKAVAGQVPDGIDVVFQEDASFPWLTVHDNVAFGLRRAGVDAAEIARSVEYAVRFMGLRDFARSYPAQLSGGMRQRVCIARTLVLQPRMILLLIAHALDEAAMLSDRVGVMSARPRVFIDLVETGWPRDRDSRIVSDPAFGAVTARLWSSLRVESMKAIGRRSAHPRGLPARVTAPEIVRRYRQMPVAGTRSSCSCRRPTGRSAARHPHPRSGP